MDYLKKVKDWHMVRNHQIAIGEGVILVLLLMWIF